MKKNYLNIRIKILFFSKKRIDKYNMNIYIYSIYKSGFRKKNRRYCIECDIKEFVVYR